MCVPSWYTHCFLRVRVFSRLSRSFFLSHHSHKQTNFEQSFLFNENTRRVSSSKSVKSLINYQIYRSRCCFRRKIQTFCGTLILLSHLFFFVFFLFERFLFERDREDLPSFPRAREQALLRTERERDLFYENVLLLGTKMGTKSTASFRRRRTRRTTTTTQRVDGGNDATPHRGFTDGEAAVDELGEDDTNYC